MSFGSGPSRSGHTWTEARRSNDAQSGWTSTPPEQAWAPTVVIEDGLADFVTELKQQSAGDIGIHGSISLAQSLLKASLVDELRLVIAPALQMRGRKLFDSWSPERLSLTRSIASPTGSLLVDYEIGN